MKKIRFKETLEISSKGEYYRFSSFVLFDFNIKPFYESTHIHILVFKILIIVHFFGVPT